MSGQELTVAAAFARIKGHEELCALRYQGIMDWLKYITMGIVTLIISLIAWMAVQLYTLEPLRVQSQNQSHNGQTTIVMPNQTGAAK